MLHVKMCMNYPNIISLKSTVGDGGLLLTLFLMRGGRIDPTDLLTSVMPKPVFGSA